MTGPKPHRLAVSPSAETRLAFARRVLDEMADSPEVLLLAPTRGAGDDFARSALKAPGRAGLHRMTLFQLALEAGIPLLAARGRTPVAGVALEAVTARAVHRTRQEGSLGYFAPVSRTVGFARAVGRTLGELRLHAAAAGELADAGPSGPDLARLLAGYEQELDEAKLADPAAVFRAGGESFDAGGARYAGLPLLLLDVLPRTTVETEFLARLAARSSGVTAVAVPQARGALARIETALGVEAQALEETGADGSLGRMRRYVFAAETPAPAPADGSLVFFSATDEGREAVEIARHIRTAANEGRRFDRIAILLRHPDLYQPLVEHALHRAGIPGYFTSGSLRPNPSGRAFLALLASRAEGLSASRFAEYLSLGQVPAPDSGANAGKPGWVPAQGELFPDAPLPPPGPEGEAGDDRSPVIAGSLRTPFDWERILVDASVIGGARRWRTRLAGLEEELRRRIVEAGTENEARREYLERQFERLVELERFALPLVDRLDALPDSATWGEWIERLEALAGESLRQPEHVLSVLAELRPMGGIGPVSLEEVQRVLSDRLSFLRTEVDSRRYGKVFVGTIGEARGRAFDMVFLPGVAEGVFPRKSLEDPLLPDEFRRSAGNALPRQEDRVQEERLLLHVAAGAARGRLVVSYPRMDLAQGRPRVPSFYALDVLRAAEGRIPDLAGIESRASGASLSRLGWPSPVSPSEAIDDAEYDLAVIAELERRPKDDARGCGHYLIGASASLARALRTRARRWRNFWSEADGLVDPGPEVAPLLEAQRPGARSYSPTALEHFAACPYRFLLQAVHRLHPREEIVRLEQMDPLTRGSLFHAVQFRLLTRLQAEGLLPVDAANLETARRIADETLDSVAAEYRETLAPAIARVWSSEVEDLRTDLGGWLAERARSGEPWLGKYFEFAFGLEPGGERDPASRPEEAVVLDGVRLRGSIDLVEEHPSNGLLRIVDHKTGRAPASAPAATGGGEVLQPMLYALAAEALLGRTVAVSELSYCTERGDYRRLEIAVDDESRRHARRVVEIVDASIRDGFLPAAPRAGACTYCDYRIVCGPYEERRTALKRAGDRKAEMERIEELREIP